VTPDGRIRKWVTFKPMLSARQQHCLKGIGIHRWLERSATIRPAEPVVEAEVEVEAVATRRELPAIARAEPPQEKTEAPAPEISKPVFDLPLDNWDAITTAIHACQACELAAHCSQKVPGVGNQQADLMIIGEGPGHDEDIKGEPFVGRSGQLLDKMLAAIGIERSQIFITNIVKCRPPNNRDPHVDEVKACDHYLQAQIKQIKPKVILSAGRISAHSLLHTSDPVGRLIKQMHRLPGSDIPIKVTYHPAYLLRNPPAKSIAWQDMKTLHQILNQ
jgi:uracil-DNA glycosylase family 4